MRHRHRADQNEITIFIFGIPAMDFSHRMPLVPTCSPASSCADCALRSASLNQASAIKSMRILSDGLFAASANFSERAASCRYSSCLFIGVAFEDCALQAAAHRHGSQLSELL